MKFEELLKEWAEDEIKSAPENHSKKTSSCISYIRFDKLIREKTLLNDEEKNHLEICPYCQIIYAMFRKEFGEKSTSMYEKWGEIRLAADDEGNAQERIRNIQNEIGNELDKVRIRITEEIHGELAIESDTELWIFLKSGQEITHKFDGYFFEFSTTEVIRVEIQKGVVLVDFKKLKTSIKNFKNVKFILRKEEKKVQGFLGDQ